MLLRTGLLLIGGLSSTSDPSRSAPGPPAPFEGISSAGREAAHVIVGLALRITASVGGLLGAALHLAVSAYMCITP